MKFTYLILFILIFPLTNQSEEINICESMSKGFYRAGYWFTIRIKTPDLFTGSHKTLVSNMGNITFKVLGKNTYSPYSENYFLTDIACPVISIYIKNGDNNTLLYKNRLKLQKLRQQDRLIGIYEEKENIQEIIYHFLKQYQNKQYLETINFLPSYEDSLNIFNLIILGSKNLDSKYIETLSKWVYSGGNIWVTHKKLFLSFQRILQEQPYKKANNIIMLKAGFGNLIYTDIRTKPILKKSICQTAFKLLSENFKNKVKSGNKLQKKLKLDCYWNKIIKLKIWAICILYLVISLITVKLYSFYKYSKLAHIIIIIFMTLVSVFFMFYILQTKSPVNCQQINIIELNNNNNFACKKSYYYFSFIKKSNLKITIPKLPILSNDYNRGKKNIEIIKAKNGWQVSLSDFLSNEYSIWNTTEYFPFNGVINAEKKGQNLIIKNYSQKKLSNCLYLQNGFFQKINEIKSWKITKEILSSQINHIFNHKKLPVFWQKIKLTNILLLKKNYIAATIEEESDLKQNIISLKNKSIILLPVKVKK